MPANYVLLEKITVGAAGASSVTFSGIPQTGYTDLVIKTSVRTDQSGVNRSFKVQPNGVDLTARRLGAEGTPTFAAYSDTGISLYAVGAGATASTFNSTDVYIPNYASTSTYKSVSIDVVNENNGTDSGMMLYAGLYSSNTAITSVTLIPNLGSFVQYSTFYLYGVAKLGTTPAIVPYATGGDTIMTDGTYWYHTFTSSGTFTPAKGLSCDVLVVAGGGGGGTNNAGGGGGAGGFRTATAQSLTTTGYTVTVGAGGAVATSGSNSVFSTITSSGGGAGGSGVSGTTGGSAGGSSGNPDGTTAATAGNSGGYSPAEGTSGGSGFGASGNRNGGGGGGATSAGQNGLTQATGGAGGSGTSNSYSGSAVTYAGGGGGGTTYTDPGPSGGAGGGGNGGGASGISPATAGTANRGSGGGGGGGSASGSGASGGSGIVIVRYAV